MTLLCFGCSAPSPVPVDENELEASIEARRTSLNGLHQALTLVGDVPLALRLETARESLEDPTTGDYWHARAIAYSPSVRKAVRDHHASQASAMSEGYPESLNFGFGVDELDAIDDQGKLEGTVDLLGLIGIGPSSAMEGLARARADRSYAALEEAIWLSWFEVDRARVQDRASRLRLERLASFREDIEPSARRLKTLFELGRFGEGLMGRIQGMIATVEGRVRDASSTAIGARSRLSASVGDPSLVGAQLPLTLWGDPQPSLGTARTAPRDLLTRLPSIRARRMDYALAEADLRVAVTSRWPSLRLGPRLSRDDGESLLGGVLRMDFPWPGSLEGRIEAAVHRREQAREALEDDLAHAMIRIESRYEALGLARAELGREAMELWTSSEAAWKAMQARIQVSDDPDVVETWLDAMMLRLRGVVALIDAQEKVSLAELDWCEAAGIPWEDGS